MLSAEKITAEKEKQASPKKLCSVNGTVIDSDELDFELKRVQQNLIRQGREVPAEMVDSLKKEILKNLENRELFYQESKKKGIKIEENLFQEHLKKLKQNFPDESKFQELLKEMNITEDKLRTQFFKDMAVNLYIQQEIVSKTQIPDDELLKFYNDNKDEFKQPEQVQASHILIKVDEKASKEDKEKALKEMKDIEAKIKKGEDFAELAKKFSACPSGKSGGDLGFFQAGQMVKPFEEAAFKLEKGKVSDIVETRFGYHIIKTTDKKTAGFVDFKEVKDKIAQYLLQTKVKEKMEALSEEFRKTAKIEQF